MERKGGNATVEVSSAEVRAVLEKTRTLTTDENKMLRMRYGIGAPSLDAPLPRVSGNRNLEDELLVIEMQLLRSIRARTAPHSEGLASLIPGESKTKDKILRALRKKR